MLLRKRKEQRERVTQCVTRFVPDKILGLEREEQSKKAPGAEPKGRAGDCPEYSPTGGSTEEKAER